MQKNLILWAAALILLSSCNTYTSTGASFGGILGSAIGGIAGGGRGSDIGTIIGMAGGAAIGAAADNARNKRGQQDVHNHYDRVQQNKARGVNPYQEGEGTYDDTYRMSSAPASTGAEDAGGFDSLNTGDDRIYDFQSADYTGDYSAAQDITTNPGTDNVASSSASHAIGTPNVVIVNPRFVDDNHDGALSTNEVGKIIFEIVNKGTTVVSDVMPSVIETSGKVPVYISPSIHVESIAPGKGIRYTAMVKSEKKLKNGTMKFALTVLQGKKSISKVTEFVVQTKK